MATKRTKLKEPKETLKRGRHNHCHIRFYGRWQRAYLWQESYCFFKAIEGAI